MKGRTIVLVSHHVQLCAPGAAYVVALDNGRMQFAGSGADFQKSGVLAGLTQSGGAEPAEDDTPDVEELADAAAPSRSSSEAAAAEEPEQEKKKAKKAPRRLVEEEKRAVGRISRDIWTTYLGACGGPGYWVLFALALGVAAISPVLENGWLKCVVSLAVEGFVTDLGGAGSGPDLRWRRRARRRRFITSPSMLS